MCPNCILNQAGLSSGVYVAYAVCLIFFIVALLAMRWAFANGEFEDMEGSKFDMMDDEPVSNRIEEAKARVEMSRARAAEIK
ncbi:MAG: cbb3-type cytochrome oxidase assembly protein CcoS [Candidatus Obscuribacterales bacterium]|nr:cbb3-type cytochrome oxidase assembly protein CcoS [Candidatus Obscuribacterales bacterium]